MWQWNLEGKDSMSSTHNVERREPHSSRTQKYFGGPGIVVMFLAAVVVIGSIILDATTGIESSKYIATVVGIVFLGSVAWKAFRAAPKADQR